MIREGFHFGGTIIFCFVLPLMIFDALLANNLTWLADICAHPITVLQDTEDTISGKCIHMSGMLGFGFVRVTRLSCEPGGGALAGTVSGQGMRAEGSRRGLHH